MAGEKAGRSGGRGVFGLVAVGLVLSVGLNAAYSIKFKAPKRFWALFEPKPPERPVIEFRNEHPEESFTPQLAFDSSITDVESFREWQKVGKAKLQECLNSELPREVPEVRLVERRSLGSVTREILVFRQHDGVEVPAFLLLPKEALIEGAAPRPAVVVIAGYSSGIVATTGIEKDFHNANALRFAEAGYVVLAMEIRGFGYLQRMGGKNQDIDLGTRIGYLIHHGQCLPGATVDDLVEGLNYLETRREVDPQRLGAVGFSFGGKAAIYLAALDERIKAVMTSGSVTSFVANFHFSQHGSEDSIPGLGRWLEMSDCVGLVAPRPMLVHWGALDNDRRFRSAAFNPDSAAVVKVAHRAYAAAGASSALSATISPDLMHEFDVGVALSWLRGTLPVDGGGVTVKGAGGGGGVTSN